MALADVLEARKQERIDAQGTALVPLQTVAVEPREQGLGGVRGPLLSQESQRVLHDAWVENSLHAYGAPIDTADLLIGLLQAPKTGPVLEQFGITVDRVRTAKRSSDGYQLASRFNAVSMQKLAKTQQVGRIARLVAENSIVAGKPLIEPEDILEILAIDGLGWGMGIMEELGLNERLLRESLARPQLLGDAIFAPAADYLARQQAGGASGLRASGRPVIAALPGLSGARASIVLMGRFVGWLLRWPGPTDDHVFLG
jgi:hypothetical protein